MYMLASLNMMTLNSTLNFIYTSESCNKCCVIYQSLSYVTHYMTKNKTPKMDLNTDRSYSVWGHSNVLSESALLSWAYSWLVRFFCMNYKFKGHVSKYEEEKTKRTMGRWWAMIVLGFLIDVFQRMSRAGFCGHDL